MTRRLAVLLYALTGGVLWWVLHLVGLSVLAPATCDTGTGGWPLHAATAVTLTGAITATWASVWVTREPSPVAEVTGRAQFLGGVAILFNLIAIALIVLEGLPPWFLGTCR